MTTIHISGTNEVLSYPNPEHKPFKCLTDKAIPKMYNRGLNVFEFEGGVEFTMSNMPVDPSKTRVGENFTWEQSSIEIRDDKGRSVSGYYYKTTETQTGKVVREYVDFS